MKKDRKNLFILISTALVLCCAVIVLIVVFLPAGAPEVQLSVSPMTISQNTSQKLSYSCSDKEAELVFEIFDKSIATIDGDIISAHKVGKTSVRVTESKSGTIATAQINVVENPSLSATDLPSEVNLFLIDKEFEKANAEGFSNEISFQKFHTYDVTMSENIVKVNKTLGKITATKVGSTILTFAYENGAQIVKVNVSKIDPKIVGLSVKSGLLPLDEFDVDYHIEPSYYTGKAEVSFDCSKEFAVVEGNRLRAMSSGSGVIKVLLNGEEVDTLSVTVNSNITFEIGRMDGCRFEDGNLIVARNIAARVKIIVRALSGAEVAFGDWTIAGENSNIEKELDGFLKITFSEDGKIAIYSQKYLSFAYLYVKVVDEL